jgi:hypothetical protein
LEAGGPDLGARSPPAVARREAVAGGSDPGTEGVRSPGRQDERAKSVATTQDARAKALTNAKIGRGPGRGNRAWGGLRLCQFKDDGPEVQSRCDAVEAEGSVGGDIARGKECR